MNKQDKLNSLRQIMKIHHVDAVLVGTSDPHQSESVAAHWKAVQWLTGFTGSVGTCVVALDQAAFWTDGRYTTQAIRELDGQAIECYTVATPGTPTWQEWLMKQVPEKAVLALDGEVLSLADYNDYQEKLQYKEIKIVYDKNLVGEIWTDRPSIPKDPLFEHEVKYAGLDRRQKLAAVREVMAQKGADCYIAGCLDDIAWLTNLRGNDNPLYPFFHAYMLIDKTKAFLCTDINKLSKELQEKLQNDGISIHDMSDIYGLTAAMQAETVYFDPYKMPYLLYKQIPEAVRKLQGMDIITHMKSMKNSVEQENIRLSNIKECVAICRLIMYIKEQIKKTEMDEFEIGRKIEEFRKMDPLYLQPGNIPIIAHGANAALPHYRPSAQTSCKVKPEGFLLFDVCAQYLCGTTDITRTIKVGPLTEEMRRDYTITLKSHIALARQSFPYGISGNILDCVAKSIHWNKHMHYRTGTGHGMGYLLNVHDGPCKIVIDYTSMFPYATTEPLDAGMLFSNEPGVYKPGRHGVRLENSILVQEETINEFGRFLNFETVTFCPFEREAIVVSLLNEDEIEWINQYHAKTYEKLSPFLNEDECVWLKERTAAI